MKNEEVLFYNDLLQDMPASALSEQELLGCEVLDAYCQVLCQMLDRETIRDVFDEHQRYEKMSHPHIKGKLFNSDETEVGYGKDEAPYGCLSVKDIEKLLTDENQSVEYLIQVIDDCPVGANIALGNLISREDIDRVNPEIYQMIDEQRSLPPSIHTREEKRKEKRAFSKMLLSNVGGG